jgi:transposase
LKSVFNGIKHLRAGSVELVMHVRDKLSERAIAKRTGLSRNTVHKWLETPEEVEGPKYVRAKTFGKLTALTGELEQALKADAHRHKQDQRTGKALFAQIKASGYLGGYSRVTDFIREWRATEGKKPYAFVPLKFELGEAFQFDWSEEGLVVGGIYRRMQVAQVAVGKAFLLLVMAVLLALAVLRASMGLYHPSQQMEIMAMAGQVA